MPTIIATAIPNICKADAMAPKIDNLSGMSVESSDFGYAEDKRRNVRDREKQSAAKYRSPRTREKSDTIRWEIIL